MSSKSKRKKRGKATRAAQLAYLRATQPLAVPTRFYWAYGSNLCEEHMRRRCPDAVKVGALILDNSALVFRGTADVVGRRGSKTPGGLWRITAADEAHLDRYEGVRSGLYRKVHITLGTEDGLEHQCLVYQMANRGVMPPAHDYVETIARGYEDFGLDITYLDRAIQASWREKAPNGFLRHRSYIRGGQLCRGVPQKRDTKARIPVQPQLPLPDAPAEDDWQDLLARKFARSKAS